MFNITAVGRVAADPELKTVGDFEVAEFRLGVDSGYDKKAEQAMTSWIKCTVWGKRAQVLADFVQKGTQLTVSGKGNHRQYETKDGAKSFSLEMKVEDFALPPKPKAIDVTGNDFVERDNDPNAPF